MSKQEKSHPLTDHSVKQRDRRHFYSEPRFIVKLDELNHFENSEQHRGNILFLSYQGDIIKGSKVYAVVNYNYIDIWEKQTSGPPPVRLFDIEEEDKEKKEKEDP